MLPKPKDTCIYCRKNKDCKTLKELKEKDPNDIVLGCHDFDFNGDANYFIVSVEEKKEPKPKKELSQAALCAKAIRSELKKTYPTIKFGIKSSNFSGGNSVHIDWLDGPTNEEIKQIVDKYQYGNFDGMTDSYDMNNRRSDIPQAKYVMTKRNYTPAIEDKIRSEIKQKWGLSIEPNKFYNQWGCWGTEVIYRELNKKSFITT